MSEPATKTVTVRIAVAVGPDGKWNSCGWSECPDDHEAFGLASECLEGFERGYILTATLAVPSVTEVEAEAEEVEE